MEKLYFLQDVQYEGYDEVEEESVEENLTIGYFSSIQALNDAVNKCLAYGIKEKNLKITTFFNCIRRGQKFAYVLSHEYSITDENGMLCDYSYIFPPLSNSKKCIELKNKLMQDEKYAYSSNRSYDTQPPDGFYIAKTEIDFIYHPIYEKTKIKR